MYSSLIDDQDYDPLLILYLTTTGATLQNHTRAQLITYALKRVVERLGRVPATFNVADVVGQHLETKRQQVQDQQEELAAVGKKISEIASVMPPPPFQTLNLVISTAGGQQQTTASPLGVSPAQTTGASVGTAAKPGGKFPILKSGQTPDPARPRPDNWKGEWPSRPVPDGWIINEANLMVRQKDEDRVTPTVASQPVTPVPAADDKSKVVKPKIEKKEPTTSNPIVVTPPDSAGAKGVKTDAEIKADTSKILAAARKPR